ncbi:hypothetical protein QIS74_08541 [Colletotrichum tabaci]|uniref:Uncharacterized protein n=1 Tax=Colletotrichum tabaci TaxID=1209068 RepID=A0AAV9T9K0_9PEZI
MSINVKIIPVENHHSVGKVERYLTAVPLQGAVKSVNNTPRLDSLVPTLLVFSAYPRMIDESPSLLDLTQCTEAIREASAAVRKLRAKRQVNDALTTRNSTDNSAPKKLAIGSQIEKTTIVIIALQ